MSSAFDDVISGSEDNDGTIERESESNDTTRHYDLAEKDDWMTPPEIVDPIAESVGGIDLDPCAHEQSTHGDVNLRLEDGDDGLEDSWIAKSNTINPVVFVNPPFSYKKEWLQKAVDEVQNGVETVIFITPDSADTISWWHQYIAEYSSYVCFCEGRVEYIDDTDDSKDRPPFGTAITVFGKASRDLLSTLDELGHVVETVSDI